MNANKKARTTVIAVSLAAVTMVTAVFAYVSGNNELKKNPWENTLLASRDGGSVRTSDSDLRVDGDIRSNGSITINGKKVSVSGYAAASENIEIPETATVGSIYENSNKITVPNVYDKVYDTAENIGSPKTEVGDLKDGSLSMDGVFLSNSSMNIDISADLFSSEQHSQDTSGKIGAFGASFFAKTYSDPEKWSKIFPVLYKEENGETKSLVQLGKNSNFIPLQEQQPDGDWSDYAELPGAAISNNFSEEKLNQYITDIKKDDRVLKICSENSTVIQADNTTNPAEAENKNSIVVQGGNFSLNGTYDDLEEIKFDSWGGSQLIGSYPNLKYIYKTSGSDLNLVGDFPSLECIYMVGGQLLLGSGDEGFSADGVKIIDDYGPIIMYTAKNVNITNSEIVTSQMILIRGAGADKEGSSFNCENTIMAAKSGIMFEDMNDINKTRYTRLPVFFSVYPMSIINCNFRLLQGAFINEKDAIIMANANIDMLRGFMFSSEGINEYRNSSAVGFYVNTYAYNISPNINNMNKQPDGTEEIGRISKYESSKFPVTLLGKITDPNKFLSDLKSENNGFEIGESDSVPGGMILGNYILANDDIVLSSDTLSEQNKNFTVIASKNGNITINIREKADITAIIYAPNGKVTITGGSYIVRGRIFAKEIDISAGTFNISGGNEDISYLGFVFDESDDTSSDIESSDISESNGDESSEVSSASESVDVESSSSEDESSNTDSKDKDSSILDSVVDDSSSDIDSSSSSSDTDSKNDSDVDKGKFTEPKYEYDLLNRLTKVIYDDDNYIEYKYDANGNIVKIVTVIDGKKQ